MTKETVADDVASRIDEPTFRGIASVEGFDAALEVYREELLKPFEELAKAARSHGDTVVPDDIEWLIAKARQQ